MKLKYSIDDIFKASVTIYLIVLMVIISKHDSVQTGHHSGRSGNLD